MTFNQVKTAQMAAWLLARCGSPMEILKLMKLLYLTDRLSLEETGQSMTGDKMVSMPHGPVLSRTLDAINGAANPVPGGWDYWITDRVDRRLGLREQVSANLENLDELSCVELEILARVRERFGHLSAIELRDYTHRNCPEWEDPAGSSCPISPQSVFLALGRSQEQANTLACRIAEDERLDLLFSRL